MLIGAVFQAAVSSTGAFIAARVISGIGMGCINSTAPVFLAEFSPKASRGRYVCAQLSLLNLGICAAYWINYGFSFVSGSKGWRIPVALQAVLIIPVFCLCFVVPESARWLAAHDKSTDALQVLAQMYGKPIDDPDVVGQYAEIMDAVNLERTIGKGRWRDLIKSDNVKSRRRVLIACSIQAFQQAGGINAIVYYAGTLLATTGLSTKGSTLVSGFLFTWFFVASFIPWFLIGESRSESNQTNVGCRFVRRQVQGEVNKGNVHLN